MSIEVTAGPQRWTLHFWWERAAEGRVVFRGHAEARAFVARLAAHGHTAALRRLAAPEMPALPGDDDALLDRLAAWLAAGRLWAGAADVKRLTAKDAQEEEAPRGGGGAAVAPADEPEPVEEAIPPPRVDMAKQAAVLREAAKYGVPFCEECERRKKQAAAGAAAEAGHG